MALMIEIEIYKLTRRWSNPSEEKKEYYVRSQNEREICESLEEAVRKVQESILTEGLIMRALHDKVETFELGRLVYDGPFRGTVIQYYAGAEEPAYMIMGQLDYLSDEERHGFELKLGEEMEKMLPELKGQHLRLIK